jgi:hypothetical protein
MSNLMEKPFDLGPILPMFGAGIDLGERLGSVDSRLNRVERDIQVLDVKIERLDAKIDAVDGRVDKCLVAINRLDERTKHLSTVTWGGIIVLLIAIVAQKLL